MSRVRFVVHGKICGGNTLKGRGKAVPDVKDTGSRICKIRVIPHVSRDGTGSIFCKVQHVTHQVLGILGHITFIVLEFFKIQTIQGNIAQCIYRLLDSGDKGIDFSTGIFRRQRQRQFSPLIGYPPGITDT